MPDLIDVAAGEPFVLEGRVVTMGPRGVITDGAVYVRAGTIEAVEARAAPGPPGFDGARRVKSGGTIYPGLIELHNHLPYNAIPIWLVPRRYENNSQWQGTHEYQRNVSKPAQVLGKTGDLIGPLIRFVECRSLLGGVTTSQGVTLTGTQVSSTKFAGLIRNVERPLVAGLEAVGTRVANPPSKEEEKLAYLETQRGALCYLAHQSEGVNDTARGWFHRLRLEDGSWAIHESFTGIHCTALRAEDFDVLAQNDAKVVWSPLSNYLLYGGTVDVGALKASGLPVGLGSDWGPSGSKNLLEELKVARLASDESGNGGFTNEQLVRMVTSDAARILRWDAAVGSIEPGKRADLLVLNGRFGNAFDRLVEARESTITLVMIDGVPRVGQERLMSHTFELEPGVERISYGGAERELYLHQEDAHELVQGVTLDGATADLDDALRHLPERAQALDNAILLSLARHPELARGAAGDRFDRDLMADARLGFEARDGNRYMVELELDPQPLHLLAGGLGDFVFPMALEPITVVSDDDHLAKLVAARNLPDFVREGLPGMYGKPVPAPWEPEGAAVLDRRFPPHVNASVRTFRSFLAERRELGVDERLRLVGQALLLLEENYVHLPFKRSMHGVDPVQRLRLLRHQLQTAKTDADAELLPADVEFHREITEIFNSLRDLHTTYRLPDPFRGVVAWLPFLVEECWEPDEGVPGGRRRLYVVSKVVGERARLEEEDPELLALEGKRVVYWNGVPIETAVARNGERCAGSNPEAKHARGLNALTIRPLGLGLPPDEDRVRISYRDGQEERVFEREWSVFMPEPALRSLDLSSPRAVDTGVTAIGLDAHTDDIQEAKKILFAPSVWLDDRAGARSDRVRNTQEDQRGLDTSLPTVFRARQVSTSRGWLGYLRIFTFNVDDAGEFVTEMGRLLEGLPARGLIIDLRGNGGGLIPAAEGALQLLTPRRIEPQRSQFINTPRNLELCRKHPDRDPADNQGRGSARLGRWTPSIDQAVRTGAVYSLGFPITPMSFLNRIEQRYFGPSVLITDALCYSAADMFAAGFQDHEIGPIVGVHGNTGAGGANVWSHAILEALWNVDAPEESPYVPLAGNADFRVAMRRTIRVGLNSGSVVEDLGIVPDAVHRMTRADLENGNRDLVEAAARHLDEWQRSRETLRIAPRADRLPRLAVDPSREGPVDLSVTMRIRHRLGEGEGPEIDLQDLLYGPHESVADVEVRGEPRDGDPFCCFGRLDPSKAIREDEEER